MERKVPEYFLIGFRETDTGQIKTIEAFSNPHDERLLEQIRPLAPTARLHEAHRLVQVRVRLSDARTEIVGDFDDAVAREMVKIAALLGARALNERVREASALVLGTQVAIRTRILPNPSILSLPVRVVAEAGETDKALEIGDARPILLNLSFRVERNTLKIAVPVVADTELFHAWGNDDRRQAVREATAKMLDEHGLFTFA